MTCRSFKGRSRRQVFVPPLILGQSSEPFALSGRRQAILLYRNAENPGLGFFAFFLGIYSFHILPVTVQPWSLNNGSLLTLR